MEESRFHIELKKLQVLEHDYAKEKMKGCHLYDGQEDFVEDYTILLPKPFCYDACLIIQTGGVRHMFELKDPLAR
jgi:hypothetical protein